jgi:hypothetical protein
MFRKTGLITLVLLLSSCATVCKYSVGLLSPIACITKFQDASFGLPMTEKDLLVVRDLLINRLSGEFLLSHDIPLIENNEVFVIKFETITYKSASKGLFGMGPMWEEKIQVIIVGSNLEVPIIDAKGFINTETKVFERQVSNKTWLPKNGDAHDRDKEIKLLKNIQKTILEVI